MNKAKLKVLLAALKEVIEELESEIYSDTEAYMEKDPYALNNVIDQHPEVSKSLVAEYDSWLNDVGKEYENMWGAKPAFIGTQFEPETHLSRQEWRDMIGNRWHVNEANGTWYLDVKKAGKYKVAFNLLQPIGHS